MAHLFEGVAYEGIGCKDFELVYPARRDADKQ